MPAPSASPTRTARGSGRNHSRRACPRTRRTAKHTTSAKGPITAYTSPSPKRRMSKLHTTTSTTSSASARRPPATSGGLRAGPHALDGALDEASAPAEQLVFLAQRSLHGLVEGHA